MNLAQIVEGHPDDAVALVTASGRTTYGELRRRAAGLRGGLAGLGLAPGDRVGIVSGNSVAFAEAYLGILGAGCTAVPLNPTSPRVELARELQAIGATAVIVCPEGAATVAAIDRRAVPTLRLVIAAGGADLPCDATLDELAEGEPGPLVDVEPDDLAVLIFTAGTAGSPKAAMLTHRNLTVNITQASQLLARALHADDVVLGVLPLFHIFGLNVVLGGALAAGGRVVLVERFGAVPTLALVRDEGCTVIPGAPPMWAAWSGLPDADPASFRTVRLATSGASRLAVEVAEAFEARFGVKITEGYGLTEASPVVTSSAGLDVRAGTIGRPLPGVEVRLVDEDGEDTLLGDAGEIWVRGPNVFPGYWQDPAATANALTSDGWLRTGDVAVADDDGNLSIVDRAKDLIIVSGFNVYPAEVEEALLEHPGVEAAAVVGAEDPATGETVKAFVVAMAGRTLEVDDLRAFTMERLARYKCPTSVTFVDELPAGLGGKVLRRALR